MTKGNARTPVLDNFGKDLTQLALEGKMDPVIGRLSEVKRCSQILSRRKKNNPILIGEPGVGKTAIVEGIAKMIVDKTCPRILFDKRIVSLEISSLVAGTKYRGQFEERMESIINEVSANPNIILFIDEIHTMVGAGSASGSLDAANILKPALSRGEIQCIGATTLDEYRESIEKDGALNRRFQQVMVEPSTPEQTRQILENIKQYYESHHSVTYSAKALDACVKLADRYLTERFFPDKAIDLLDEAGANVHIDGIVVPQIIRELEDALGEISKNKRTAVESQKYEAAAKLRDAERDQLAKIDEAKVEWEKTLKDNRLEVDDRKIAEVVATMTGIPVSKLTQTDLDKIALLESDLGKRVIGQEEAIKKLARAIKRSRANIASRKKPIGTFMFLGPTGVGKTELAKALAHEMFDSEENMIRVDMNEYGEKFTASKMMGAPPGYVGYEDGGQLTEKVRRKPYSVVLLDEIEKAHPDIFNSLLQILDEGYAVDGKGRKINFRNTVIIMTSNVGVRDLQDRGVGIGFATANNIEKERALAKSILDKALKNKFQPEFLNRVDDIIIFDSLEKAEIRQILEIELKNLLERSLENGYTFELDQLAKDFIIEHGYDEKYGARPIKRMVQNHVEDLLAELWIDGKLKDNGHVNITASADSTGLAESSIEDNHR